MNPCTSQLLLGTDWQFRVSALGLKCVRSTKIQGFRPEGNASWALSKASLSPDLEDLSPDFGCLSLDLTHPFPRLKITNVWEWGAGGGTSPKSWAGCRRVHNVTVAQGIRVIGITATDGLAARPDGPTVLTRSTSNTSKRKHTPRSESRGLLRRYS